MSTAQERIANNVTVVRQQIADAANRSGRTEDSVTLVAVTKYADAAETRLLVEAGCLVLGESRPQLLWQKAQELADLENIEWHQIGHMQRNKLARTLPIISLFQSVDSERLLQATDEVSAKLNRATDVLLEVNISGDSTKHGFAPSDMSSIVQRLDLYSHISVRGIMGMASLLGGKEQARRDFAALRDLRDSLLNYSETIRELSMGMSGDFDVAIEEGATIVRVGSALFE
ncbi:MAG: YggS family pyridoxal phosphate-dependent enzyme [Planctomycetales bacterium]|nr:YggS family pyridoxal phosphate-dependent enzyme [Planctomycetales bacterium]